ncbi:MAG: ABC transporter permease, partial [Bacteroidota bacterium]
MVKNILKIALRNLLKYRSFSIINITGLAGGLTCCLLILLFVVDEYSYDNFQTNKDRLYRVQYQINNLDIASIPPVMSDHIRSYFSEIEEVARMYNRGISVRIGDDDRFEESRAFFADSTLLNMFTFNVVSGQLSTSLDQPYSVILNQTTAEKYFPDENPIGKQIAVEGGNLFQVTAVVEDYPPNSHLHFDLMMPYQNMYDVEPEHLQNTIRQNFQMNWMVSHSYTYVQLKPDADPQNVNAKFPSFVDEKMPENMKRGQNFLLQPMHDFHLNNVVAGGPEPPGSQLMIYILIAVGILTLVIACINFINLTTARFVQRGKEIGIRKVLGARKQQLILQFLSEAFVLTLVAAVASYFLAQVFLPLINDLLDKQLSTQSLLAPNILMAYFGLIIVTSLVAGIYPAFVVTKITPFQSLKGTLSANTSSLSLRKALVVVQFSVSSLLVIGAIIVFNQLQYVNQRSLGFNKNLIINVPIQSQNLNNLFGGINGEMRSKMNSFEESLHSIPGVQGSTVSAGAPGFGVVNRNVIPEGFTSDDRIIAPVYAVDYDFIDLYDIEIVAGRGFSTSFGTDHQQAFMINEKALKEYNLGESPEDALGKNVNVEGKEGKIVGVLGDFNYLPLTQEIGPLIMEIG